MTVDNPGPEWIKQNPKWKKARTLEGGTDAMRKAGETYLRKFEGESPERYKVRLNSTTLFNGFRRAKVSLEGKVFSKPVMVENDMPPRLAEWANDVDMQGNDIHQFAKNWFDEVLSTGLSHVLVEFPEMAAARTLADEQGARPYLVHIEPERLLGGRVAYVAGREILMQIRIRETETRPDPDDEFGEKLVERVRVIEKEDQANPGSRVIFRVFEKPDSGAFMELPEEGGVLSLPDIPLVTFYADKKGFLLSRQPLDDLADKNIEHWVSASDQRNSITFARFPMLSATGLQEGEADQIVIGPNMLLESESEQASFQVIETSGAALSAGRQDLEDIKTEMQILAMEPLMPGSGNTTATARALDTAEANCALQSMALGLQGSLEQAFKFMGQWVGLEGGSVAVNTGFGLTFNEQVQLDALIKMRQGGDLSQRTLWQEFARRDVLSDDFDPDAEQEAIENEGVALGEIPPAEDLDDAIGQ